MHPRTREVRRPDSGIDPRGSGTGQAPLLQGYLKHGKGQPPAGSGAPAENAADDADVTVPKAPAPKRARAAKPKAGR
jgi:hypothetical protein